MMATYLPQKPLSEKWMKASVVGSLWAVVEIILGSLLHNLKIPLAGSILSCFTVFLLVAFFQLWNLPGMIVRAGLICALMKSLSPGAIILGPMIGILTEALILEAVIFGLGKNIVAYAVGGALAVFSALVHKALMLLIRSLHEPADLLVTDEIGPLETRGQGWAPALEQVIGQNDVPHLWVVRENLLKPVLSKWNTGDVRIFDLSSSTVEEIAQAIRVK